MQRLYINVLMRSSVAKGLDANNEKTHKQDVAKGYSDFSPIAFFRAETNSLASKYFAAKASASYSFFLEKIFIAKPVIIEIGEYKIPKAIRPMWKLGVFNSQSRRKLGTTYKQ